METLSMVVGIVGMCILLTLFALIMSYFFPIEWLNEKTKKVSVYKHEILWILVAIIVLSMLFFIPRVGMESREVCSVELNTTNVTATNYTEHTYGLYCFQRNDDVAESWYTNYVLAFRIIMYYLGVCIPIWLFLSIWNRARMRRLQ